MTSIEAYRQGWIDGHSADNKYPQTVTIAGYSLDQILDIISDKESDAWTPEQAKRILDRGEFIPEVYSKEKRMTEPKFTREEAIEKIKKATDKNFPTREIGVISNDVDMLETLGLIKFKEPTPLSIMITSNDGKKGNTFTIGEIDKALAQYDFEIVPKGNKS